MARIVFEPTGPYHRAFEAAFGQRFPLEKVNPLPARQFSKASGTRGKTDAAHSRRLKTNRLQVNRSKILALHKAAFDLAPMAPCSPDARLLKDLHVARAGLVKDRTNLCNRAKVQEIAVLKRQTKARLAQL